MSEREELPRKLHSIHDEIQKCVRQDDFDNMKSCQQKELSELMDKMKKMMMAHFPNDIHHTIKELPTKLTNVGDIELNVQKIGQIQLEIDSIKEKVGILDGIV